MAKKRPGVTLKLTKDELDVVLQALSDRLAVVRERMEDWELHEQVHEHVWEWDRLASAERKLLQQGRQGK